MTAHIPQFQLFIWPSYRLVVAGMTLWLPPGQGAILALLASSHRAGRCLPMADMIGAVYLSDDPDREPEDAEGAIRVQIMSIRRKLAQFGVGFTISCDRAGYHLATHQPGQRAAIGRPGRRRFPAAPAAPAASQRLQRQLEAAR